MLDKLKLSPMVREIALGVEQEGPTNRGLYKE